MKLAAWTVLLIGMITFLTLMGLPTGLTSTLEKFGLYTTNGEITEVNIEGSSMWDYILGLEGILAGFALSSAIIAGLYWKTGDTNLLAIPGMIFIGQLLMALFYPTIKLVSGTPWATAIVSLVFVTLSGGFIVSLYDYFLGR